MHKLLLLALLVFTITRTNAQGICDSTISIAPIQPLCEGTDERYLQATHPGGVFSGPGLIYGGSYLTSENLSSGFYTATYTITGPGGCTVQATRQFQVRDAEVAFTSTIGQIDCSNPNSTVVIQAFLPNSQNYWGGSWYGPAYSNVQIFGNNGMTDFAGTYRYLAYPVNSNDCPAYGVVDVDFVNNQTPVTLANCTDCNSWPVKVKVEPIPPGWHATLRAPNGAYVSGSENCTAISSFFPSGLWRAEILNDQNGCVSKTAVNINTDNAAPSVSAGSNLGLWCGGTGHLLPAMSPQSGVGLNYFWTTPNGTTIPAAYAQLLPVTTPGTYVLHGVNTFTGCEDTDTTIVFPPVTPVTTQIHVICDGESLNGHTESGSYVDTIPLPNGCKKVEYIKLIVLAPLFDTVEVTADNGQMTGSIQYEITQGWGPFSYYWSTGDVTASISNLSAGEYTVTVTDANNCEHIRTVEVPAGRPIKKPLAERSESVSIYTRLYPNPVAAGLVKCTLEVVASAEAGDATVMVNDVLGRTISTQQVALQEGKNVVSWPETLTEGVYTLFLKGSFGLKQVSKLVVVSTHQ